MAAYRRAIELRPDYAEARSNLGAALAGIGRLNEAIAECREILRLKPEHANGWSNLGSALREQGKFDEAAAAYRKAIYADPCHANAKFNLALILLLRGKFVAAWPLYEARRVYERRFPQAMWGGGMLSGQRVLIHAEQGFGDAIQFVRYTRLVAERGGEVVVECQRALVEIFRTASGVSQVVAAGEPLPPFDAHLPMLSLPFVFKTTKESIPREVPYLFADPARREIWRERLGADPTRLRVGLAWAGNPNIAGSRKRHLSLDRLLAVLQVPGVDFFSLQMDGGTEEIRQLPETSGIIDHTPCIQDFADTAALMMELDLIISVDTAAAHLAGALGRPAWTLLPWVPDWRWGLECEENPWYPTMRLFRQPKLDDWDEAIGRVVAALRERSAER